MAVLTAHAPFSQACFQEGLPSTTLENTNDRFRGVHPDQERQACIAATRRHVHTVLTSFLQPLCKYSLQVMLQAIRR